MKKGYLYLIVSNEDPGEPFHCFHLHTLVECTDEIREGVGEFVNSAGMHQTLYPEHVEEIGAI